MENQLVHFEINHNISRSIACNVLDYMLSLLTENTSTVIIRKRKLFNLYCKNSLTATITHYDKFITHAAYLCPAHNNNKKNKLNFKISWRIVLERLNDSELIFTPFNIIRNREVEAYFSAPGNRHFLVNKLRSNT